MFALKEVREGEKREVCEIRTSSGSKYARGGNGVRKTKTNKWGRHGGRKNVSTLCSTKADKAHWLLRSIFIWYYPNTQRVISMPRFYGSLISPDIRSQTSQYPRFSPVYIFRTQCGAGHGPFTTAVGSKPVGWWRSVFSSRTNTEEIHTVKQTPGTTTHAPARPHIQQWTWTVSQNRISTEGWNNIQPWGISSSAPPLINVEERQSLWVLKTYSFGSGYRIPPCERVCACVCVSACGYV